MRDKNSIYSKSRYDFNKALLRAENDNIDTHNKKLILQFIHQHYSKGISEQRCVKLLAILRNLCKMTTERFEHFTREDIIQVINTIKGKTEYAPATKQDYILVLKMLFKWYESEDDRIYADDMLTRKKSTLFYKFVRETKMKSHRKVVNPNEILNDSDIEDVLKHCHTIRDRAFIKLLHESGVRIQEMLCLEIKDLTFDKEGTAHLHVPDCKTGPRRIPIVFSVPLLRTYIENHRFKHEPNSPLWWNEDHSNSIGPLRYAGATQMIRKLWKKLPETLSAKKKPHNAHFFRHSRATLLAPHLTAELLCKYMGWTPGSRQARTYVHLCPKDLDNAFWEKLGIKSPEELEDQKPKTCSLCETMNSPVAEYCMKCGRPLTVERALLNDHRDTKTLSKNIGKLKEILKDPSLLEMINSGV